MYIVSPEGAPERSSRLSLMNGECWRSPYSSPSGWITPLVPSVSSYRQPRSRSTAVGCAEATGSGIGLNSVGRSSPRQTSPELRRAGPSSRLVQCRLTCIVPATTPFSVSATSGEPLLSVTRSTPASKLASARRRKSFSPAIVHPPIRARPPPRLTASHHHRTTQRRPVAHHSSATAGARSGRRRRRAGTGAKPSESRRPDGPAAPPEPRAIPGAAAYLTSTRPCSSICPGNGRHIPPSYEQPLVRSARAPPKNTPPPGDNRPARTMCNPATRYRLPARVSRRQFRRIWGTRQSHPVPSGATPVTVPSPAARPRSRGPTA